MVVSVNPVILLAQAAPVREVKKAPEKVTTYVTDDVNVKIKEKGDLVTIEGTAWGSNVKISIDPKKNEASVEVKGGKLFWRLMFRISAIAMGKWGEDDDNVKIDERFYDLDIIDTGDRLKISGRNGGENIVAEVNLQTKEVSIKATAKGEYSEEYMEIRYLATDIIKEIAFDPKYENDGSITQVWDKVGIKAKYPK